MSGARVRGERVASCDRDDADNAFRSFRKGDGDDGDADTKKLREGLSSAFNHRRRRCCSLVLVLTTLSRGS